MGKISDALEKAMRGEDTIPDSEKGKEERDKMTALPSSAEPESSVKKSSSPEEVHQSAQNQVVPETVMPEKVTAQGKWDDRLNKAINFDDYMPEVFKMMRSRILLPQEGKRIPRTIMITSVAPKEGKSFITANLGVSIAQGMDQYSLLVSCDLRRPSLSSLFGANESYGLVDYLSDNKDLTDLIQKTSVPKLSILASGKPPVNPAELLGSARMRTLVKEIAQRYDDRIIIFDSPPFQLAAESAALAKMVDSVILVVRQGGAAKHQVKKLIEKIGRDRLLGVVFNGHTTSVVERTLMKGYGSYPSQAYT